MQTRKKTSGKLLLAGRTLSALVLALRRQGLSVEQISAAAERALDAAKPMPPKRSSIPITKDSALIGSALALWIRDKKFVDKSGSPRPMRAYGKRPSVEFLLRTAGLGQDTKTGVAYLINSGLLLKRGRGKYVPSSRSARIAAIDDYFAEHIAHGVMRLVETAHFNFSTAGKKSPLLQRAAAVRALPVSLRKKYREYVNEQGNAFITNIDDWLEARCVRGGGVSGAKAVRLTQAGVYAFAYCD